MQVISIAGTGPSLLHYLCYLWTAAMDVLGYSCFHCRVTVVVFKESELLVLVLTGRVIDGFMKPV